jgi:predicted nucleic acid-binding protein
VLTQFGLLPPRGLRNGITVRTIVDLPEAERVGCREGESGRVEAWLDTFPRLPLNDAIALESVRLRQRHGLKIPDAIILATAHCADLTLASRNSRDFPLALGGVVHPYEL